MTVRQRGSVEERPNGPHGLGCECGPFIIGGVAVEVALPRLMLVISENRGVRIASSLDPREALDAMERIVADMRRHGIQGVRAQL